MKTEVKKKWLKALRSGKYKQGRKQLQDNAGYCCLGVLACIADPHGTTWEAADGSFGYYKNQRALVGHIPNNAITDLIGLNDTEGKTFSQIANWISKNVKAGPGRPKKAA